MEKKKGCAEGRPQSLLRRVVGAAPVGLQPLMLGAARDSYLYVPATHRVEHPVLFEVVRAAPLNAKKAAVAEAVKTAPDTNKQDIAAVAMRSLSSDGAQEVARDFPPITQATADQIWLKVVDAFKVVLWGATVALFAAIGVALFKEVDQATPGATRDGTGRKKSRAASPNRLI